MSHPSGVSGAMQLPFDEQIAFFRQKLGNLVPTQAWDDLLGEAHDDGFMVAGAMKADLLADLAAAVDKAIAEGRGIDEFRKDFDAIVARNGWTGWTGQGTVQGEAWRTRTILRTNAYTSYAAGRFAQLEARNFSFWVYLHGDSREPRLEHLSWNGVALAPDHPFWRTHYPPSDWGCSCYVVGANTPGGIRRAGGNPAKKLPDGWQKIDRKTGAPVGIGKGWGYAPGASVAPLVSAMAAKISSWDFRVAKAFMDSLPAARVDELSIAYRALPSTADDARRYARRIFDDMPEPVPGRTLGMMTSDAAAALEEAGVARAAGFDFSLSPDELRHVRNRHGPHAKPEKGQRPVSADDFARLPAILNAGMPRYVGNSETRGFPVIEVEATISGERYVTRWENWQRRRTWTLLSFFVKTKS